MAERKHHKKASRGKQLGSEFEKKLEKNE